MADKIQIWLEVDASKGVATLKDFDRAVEEVGRTTAGVDRQFLGLGSTLGWLSGALAGLSLATVGKQFIGVAAGAESARKTLEGLGYGADAAGRQIDTLLAKDYAKVFGFEQIKTAQVRLETVRGAVGDVDRAMKALTDSVAAFGGTSAQLDRATIAIQQIAGKGVASLEEIRQQLSEAIPDAAQLMARGLGLSMAEFTKLVESGALDAKTALNAMFREMEREHGGAVSRMLGTWTGMTQQMGFYWQSFAKQTMEKGGVFQELEGQARHFLDVLGQLEEEGVLEGWAESLGGKLTTVVKALGWAAENANVLATAAASGAGVWAVYHAEVWQAAGGLDKTISLAQKLWPLIQAHPFTAVAAGIGLAVTATVALGNVFESAEERARRFYLESKRGWQEVDKSNAELERMEKAVAELNQRLSEANGSRTKEREAIEAVNRLIPDLKLNYDGTRESLTQLNVTLAQYLSLRRQEAEADRQKQVQKDLEGLEAIKTKIAGLRLEWDQLNRLRETPGVFGKGVEETLVNLSKRVSALLSDYQRMAEFRLKSPELAADAEAIQKSIGGLLEAIAAAGGKVGDAPAQALAKINQAAQVAAAATGDALRGLGQDQEAAARRAAEALSELGKRELTDVQKKLRKLDEEYQKYYDTLADKAALSYDYAVGFYEKDLAYLRRVHEVERARILEPSLKRETEAHERELERRKRAAEKLAKEEFDLASKWEDAKASLREKGGGEVERQLAHLQNEFAKYYKSLEDYAAGNYDFAVNLYEKERDEVDRLYNVERNKILAKADESWRRQHRRSWEGVLADWADGAKHMEELTANSFKNIQDMAARDLARGLKGEFKSIEEAADAVFNNVVNLAAQAVSQMLVIWGSANFARLFSGGSYLPFFGGVIGGGNSAAGGSAAGLGLGDAASLGTAAWNWWNNPAAAASLNPAQALWLNGSGGYLAGASPAATNAIYAGGEWAGVSPSAWGGGGWWSQPSFGGMTWGGTTLAGVGGALGGWMMNQGKGTTAQLVGAAGGAAGSIGGSMLATMALAATPLAPIAPFLGALVGGGAGGMLGGLFGEETNDAPKHYAANLQKLLQGGADSLTLNDLYHQYSLGAGNREELDQVYKQVAAAGQTSWWQADPERGLKLGRLGDQDFWRVAGLGGFDDQALADADPEVIRELAEAVAEAEESLGPFAFALRGVLEGLDLSTLSADELATVLQERLTPAAAIQAQKQMELAAGADNLSASQKALKATQDALLYTQDLDAQSKEQLIELLLTESGNVQELTAKRQRLTEIQQLLNQASDLGAEKTRALIEEGRELAKDLGLQKTKWESNEEAVSKIVDAVQRLIDKLDSIPSSKDVTVNYRERHLTDDSSSYHSGGVVLHRGGEVPPRRYHAGSLVTRLAPDEVPAILQRGEFVMRREAVSALGLDFMAAANRGQLPATDGGTVIQINAPLVSVDGGVFTSGEALNDLARLLEAKLYDLTRGRYSADSPLVRR